jgi:hypothetical protein
MRIKLAFLSTGSACLTSGTPKKLAGSEAADLSPLLALVIEARAAMADEVAEIELAACVECKVDTVGRGCCCSEYERLLDEILEQSLMSAFFRKKKINFIGYFYFT